MVWKRDRAQARIKQHMQSAPTVDSNVTLAEHRLLAKKSFAEARAAGRFPNARAVAVTGAHVYGVLLDFDDQVVDSARQETEASHKRVLEFLHVHYSVWDGIVDGEDALRIDFHGPRLHAVITEPKDNPREQVKRAVALAAKLEEAARRVGAAQNVPSRTRFGIDHGVCLALTTGRSHDTDTLFLGSPANHAAKLAAADLAPGIYLTHRAQTVESGKPADPMSKMARAETALLAEATRLYRFASVDVAAERVVKGEIRKPVFAFFRPAPPLADLKFDDLVPSNTARMGMASLFADIDGYTAFIDKAIRKGTAAVKEAVMAIHVLREELNDVLKADFKGKRVRFIGDCIHGLIAEGSAKVDGPGKTVSTSALCASGMRSSFDLCAEMVPGVDELDLAIGIEFGPVPLTRIGKTGAESIRCAAGKAVVTSEREQQAIDGGGVRLGENARKVASAPVLRNYSSARRILDYDDAVNLLGAVQSPIVATVTREPAARSHTAK